jgi:hypothetical protein
MSTWKELPFSLIGKRVDIEWKQSQRHRGTVIRYNPHFHLHTVQYDDGETKEYDMYTRRFWIIGESPEGFHPSPRPSSTPSSTGAAPATTSGGAATSTGGYSSTGNYGVGGYNYNYPTAYTYQWTPYTTRFPGSSNAVTFHVLLDARMLGAAETVRINGNLPVMSASNGGIPMVMENDSRLVWSVTLTLPFSITDFSVNGMFQFHYEIYNSNDELVSVEGQGERTEQRLRTYFFHSFRPNLKVARFRTINSLTPKANFQGFVREEISALKAKRLNYVDAFSRLVDIYDCCTGCAKVHMEELYEDEIDVVEAAVSCFYFLIRFFILYYICYCSSES